MLEIVGTKIILTRGDSASITLTPTEDSEYIPAEGDSIRFAMSKQYGATTPLVLIDIPTDTMGSGGADASAGSHQLKIERQVSA